MDLTSPCICTAFFASSACLLHGSQLMRSQSRDRAFRLASLIDAEIVSCTSEFHRPDALFISNLDWKDLMSWFSFGNVDFTAAAPNYKDMAVIILNTLREPRVGFHSPN